MALELSESDVLGQSQKHFPSVNTAPSPLPTHERAVANRKLEQKPLALEPVNPPRL